MKWPHTTYRCVAHADTMDTYTGRCVHNSADRQLRLDGWVEHSLLLLQVEHKAQLWQWQAGRSGQAKQCVVEVHSVAAQPPVMWGTWGKESEMETTNEDVANMLAMSKNTFKKDEQMSGREVEWGKGKWG